MSLRLFLLWVGLMGFYGHAFAADAVLYRDSPKGVREREVLDYLKLIKRYNPALPVQIGTVDLNGDGVDEWVVRQNDSPACDVKADCRFTVAGLSEKEPVLLGEFQARKVGIADEKWYGVRKLLVYNEKNNDYAYKTYVWNPLETAFRPE